MQSTWGESWKSSESITTKIAFTSRLVAAPRENDLAIRRPPMPSLITTPGGTIAAGCFRCQSQRNLRIRHGQLQGAPDRCRWLVVRWPDSSNRCLGGALSDSDELPEPRLCRRGRVN